MWYLSLLSNFLGNTFAKACFYLIFYGMDEFWGRVFIYLLLQSWHLHVYTFTLWVSNRQMHGVKSGKLRRLKFTINSFSVHVIFRASLASTGVLMFFLPPLQTPCTFLVRKLARPAVLVWVFIEWLQTTMNNPLLLVFNIFTLFLLVFSCFTTQRGKRKSWASCARRNSNEKNCSSNF